MFMSFEIVSICVWRWYLFQNHVVLQLIHINRNSTCLGFHATDECLEQFFVCFPTLLRIVNSGEGFSISLIGTTFPWY